MQNVLNMFKHVPIYEEQKPKCVHPAIVMVDPELETGKRLPLPIGEHDDPSLDLTDGPVMVKVESTSVFLLKNNTIFFSHLVK
jgi:hypothetical protein